MASPDKTPLRESMYAMSDVELEDAIGALEAEVVRLREALIAMREVAAVADNGDPWYCEHEGIDSAVAFRLATVALGEESESG